MFPILILRVLPCSFLSSGFSTTCLHQLLPPKCRSSCGSHMPSAHLGTACHGCSVAQPATHTANPCVPACCRAGHPSSQWDSCLAEHLQRPGKCNGLADPASVSEAASQTPVFGSKLWKRQQVSQFWHCRAFTALLLKWAEKTLPLQGPLRFHSGPNPSQPGRVWGADPLRKKLKGQSNWGSRGKQNP